MEIEEHSHADLANAYVAGASGLPFAVLRAYAGSDLPKVNPLIKTVTCPFTGEVLAAVPSVRPDVTVIHAQKADRKGNVLLWGILGVQKEAALAAKRCIVTVEEIVDDLNAPMNACVLPTWALSAVCHVPGGAHPSYAHGYYRARQPFLPGVGLRSPVTVRRLPPGSTNTSMASADFSEFKAKLAACCGGQVMNYSTNEMMTVAAARRLKNGAVCFVGIGLPSKAANLARLTSSPDVVLIYESGPIGAKPDVLPLSIGDGELAETADTVVSTSEIFRYWLQGGRIDVGFLGAAQVDRFGNINTTVVGDYHNPKVRLPGAGGAPEIAGSAKEVLIILKQSPRTFVNKLDFLTSVGHGEGGDSRKRLGLPGAGPVGIITDLCIMEPEEGTHEFVVTDPAPGRDPRAGDRRHRLGRAVCRHRGEFDCTERVRTDRAA